jgi:hypothetical protein
MTKQAKTRLVRLGDAKRLTKGDFDIGTELNGRVEPQGG